MDSLNTQKVDVGNRQMGHLMETREFYHANDEIWMEVRHVNAENTENLISDVYSGM